MTRNRFNQVNHGTSTDNISPSKGHCLFLEDNDNIDMKDTYKITNIHLPSYENDVFKQEYCYKNLLSSNIKIDILCKNN